jgi:hypothetical protein
MSTDNDNDTPERQPLAVFFRQHRKGLAAQDIETKMQEVSRAVQEHGKKGSVTIKFEFSPGRDGLTIFVTDDVKANVPQADRGGTIMFPDEKGNLHRSDPNQMRLERFHVVETANDDTVVVDTGTGEVREIH